jgi:phage-related protein
MLWNIEFYQSRNGKYPVEEFIDCLEVKSQARIARTLDLLEEFGIELGIPYAKYLEKQLWELRIRVGRNRYRIIYFLHTEKTFILLHVFSKKTDAVSRADIEIAKNRRDDFLSRRRKGL